MRAPQLITALVLGGFTLTGSAASLIEMRTNDGATSRMYIDGQRARLEMGAREDGILLMDGDQGRMIMVMPAEGRAIDASEFLNAAPTPAGMSGPEVELDAAGSGPDIAGYDTERYDFSVQGKRCGSVFVSKQALDDTGADVILNAMNRMSAQTMAIVSSFSTADPCAFAEAGLQQPLAKLGMPMRILDTSGHVESEVLRIDTHATPPAGAFEVPAGIQVRTTSEEMAAAAQQFQQNMPPGMDAMLEQMQQSGGMPPEVMEQMRRAQEQMQQYMPSPR